MAFKIKDSLRAVEVTRNGVKVMDFTTGPVTYDEGSVIAAQPYFNPLTGAYDEEKSVIFFGTGTSILLDQSYTETETELNA